MQISQLDSKFTFLLELPSSIITDISLIKLARV